MARVGAGLSSTVVKTVVAAFWAVHPSFVEWARCADAFPGFAAYLEHQATLAAQAAELKAAKDAARMHADKIGATPVAV